MPDKQLTDFITNQLKAGVSRDQIKNSLIQNGWTSADVEMAFLNVGAIPSSNPVPLSPSFRDAASASPATPATPASPTSQNSGFVGGMQNGSQNTSQGGMDTNSFGKGSNMRLWLGIAIAVLVVFLGGAGTWAYFSYVSPNPQATIDKSLTNLADQIDQKGFIATANSVDFRGSGNLPQNPGNKSTANFHAGFKTLANIKSGKMSSDLSFSLFVNAGPTMTLNIDGQDFLSLVYTTDKQYIRLNKIPTGLMEKLSPMLMLQPNVMDFINKEIVSKWIEVDQEQLQNLSKAGSSAATLAGFYSLPKVNMSNINSVMRALADSKAIVIDQVLPSATIDGQGAFHYRVKFDKVGLTNFFIATAKILGDGKLPSGVDEQSIKDGVDRLFTQADSLAKSGTKISTDLYVGRFSKMPVKLSVNIDASNDTQMKSSGADTAVANFDTSFDSPASTDVVEPTSFTTVTDLLFRVGIFFGSSTPSSRSSSRLLVIPSKSSVNLSAQPGATYDYNNSFSGGSSTYDYTVPSPRSCIQLGSNGSFVASKSGTLTLYFNDNMFGDNAKSYSVSINGSHVNVNGGSSRGTIFGQVTKGLSYSYVADTNAMVQLNWAPSASGGGYNTNLGSIADPDGVVYSWDNQDIPSEPAIAGADFICPGLKSFSLVGVIQ
jgi:hypothetical protein